MAFDIQKQDNLPQGLFRPPNNLPPGLAAFVDCSGAPIVNPTDPGNLMALHHIVSKEKLKKLFDGAAGAGDLDTKVFKELCKAVVAKHYARQSKPTSDGCPLDVAFQDSNGSNVKAGQVTGCLASVLGGAYTTREAANRSSNGVWQLFENFFFWWPGNLHHGPRSRLNPDHESFEADRDDGGKGFEQAAKHVVADAQFRCLAAVDKGIDGYLQAIKDERSQSVRRGYLEQIRDGGWVALLKVGPLYAEPTPFDKTKWKPQTLRGTTYYRLKRG